MGAPAAPSGYARGDHRGQLCNLGGGGGWEAPRKGTRQAGGHGWRKDEAIGQNQPSAWTLGLSPERRDLQPHPAELTRGQRRLRPIHVPCTVHCPVAWGWSTAQGHSLPTCNRDGTFDLHVSAAHIMCEDRPSPITIALHDLPLPTGHGGGDSWEKV